MDNLLKQLRRHEGYHRQLPNGNCRPYVCPAGKCTIGYGTNLEAHPRYIADQFPETARDIKEGRISGRKLVDFLCDHGLEWSREKAEGALLDEVQKCVKELTNRCQAYKVLLQKGENCRADILVNMAFNMGVAGLLGFKNTLAKIEAGKYEAAAEGMENSRWYKQVGNRSKELVKQMRTGRYETFPEPQAAANARNSKPPLKA